MLIGNAQKESLAGKMVAWQVLLCRFISTIQILSESSRKYISTQLSFTHIYASTISLKELTVILSHLSGTFDSGRFDCKTTVVENEIEYIGSQHQHKTHMVPSVEQQSDKRSLSQLSSSRLQNIL
ncbi:Hypothetical_protein [Hexamita inflata]|uniref:Hypothetical_protein n=1 Tax=Hexamita inflata TaxID=28002 RepID=A0AA86QVW0_9EUKA|nr:Hypothetical protein HINF_LOCUS46135 [Hexamita inflata]